MVFLTQVSVHKTDANLGYRASWAEVPRERGARSGVNKKHFGGTAGSRDLPKSSRAFARQGRGREAYLQNRFRPVPKRARSRARGKFGCGQESCYVRKQGGSPPGFSGGV